MVSCAIAMLCTLRTRSCARCSGMQEAGSHPFWFGLGRPVLEKITEADPAVAEEMASFLLTRDQTLDQLSEVNQFFKSERTRVLLLGALADKLAEEI